MRLWARKNRWRRVKPRRSAAPRKDRPRPKPRRNTSQSKGLRPPKPHSRPEYSPRPWTRRDLLYLLLLAALCGVLFFSALGVRSLWETDEARYAEIAREMLARGDWITPHLNYVKYFEKPPLTYWLVALGFRLFGVGEAGARLVPAVCGSLTVLLVFLLGRAMWGARQGLGSGVVLATSLMFFGLSRVLMTDMVLCLGVVTALFGAWQARAGAWWGALVFWLGCVVGFLSKGLLGPGLPLLVVVLFAALGGEWGLLRRLADWRGVVLFLVLGLPWVILVSLANPGFFTYFFVEEHLGRLLTTHHHRYQPPWFYLGVLPAGFFPWVALLPWAVGRTWPGRAWRSEEQRPWLWLMAWAGGLFLFFSLSSSKMMHYILPVMPALALWLGWALGGLGDLWRAEAPVGVRAGLVGLAVLTLAAGAGLPLVPGLSPDVDYRHVGWLLLAGPVVAAALGVAVFALRRRGFMVWAGPAAVFLAVVACAVAAVPRLDAYRSVKGLVAPLAAELKPGDVLVNYDDYYQGTPFYSRRRVVVVRNWGELDYGRRHDPRARRWFLPGDRALVRLLQDPRRRVIVLAETQAFHRLERHIRGTPGVLLFEWARLGDKSLFSNRPR